jgi:hypothetical protein
MRQGGPWRHRQIPERRGAAGGGRGVVEMNSLNRLAFANSLAVLTAALYVLFAILALVSPALFALLFDAQFFGANVASLLPKVQPSAASLVTLVLMIGMSWVLGYVWAWLYNQLAKVS